MGGGLLSPASRRSRHQEGAEVQSPSGRRQETGHVWSRSGKHLVRERRGGQGARAGAAGRLAPAESRRGRGTDAPGAWDTAVTSSPHASEMGPRSRGSRARRLESQTCRTRPGRYKVIAASVLCVKFFTLGGEPDLRPPAPGGCVHSSRGGGH